MRRYRAGAAAAFRQLYQPPGKHKQSTKDRLEKKSFAPECPEHVLAGLAVCGSFLSQPRSHCYISSKPGAKQTQHGWEETLLSAMIIRNEAHQLYPHAASRVYAAPR